MERTINLGERWTKTTPLNAANVLAAIQPTILLHSPDRIQILCRTKQGAIAEAWSADAGATWRSLKLTALPNPNSAIDAVRLRDGRFLLVYNHSATNRNVLNVALSHDGQEWQSAAVLEEGSGEYSYPAVIQAHDGTVHITYTWKREKIKHVALDPAKLGTEQ